MMLKRGGRSSTDPKIMVTPVLGDSCQWISQLKYFLSHDAVYTWPREKGMQWEVAK